MKRLTLALSVLLCLVALPARGEDVYQQPEAFVAEAFGGKAPEAEIFWITKSVQPAVSEIMGDHYRLLRTRYWREGGRTVWILEEIGKVKPITAGFVVENNSLVAMKVLIYRESHGWEVRHDFFTNQFKGRQLDEANKLDRRIDGISGATLSVNALTRLSRLALYLHEQVTEP